MDVIIETPTHNDSILFIEQRRMSPYQMDTAVQGMAFAALNSLRTSLSSHIRTGLTTESLQIRKLGQTDSIVRYGVGTWSRGAQLYWLDQGRGEVTPKNRKYLKFQTWPAKTWIYAKRARATKGIGCMAQAAEKASQSANQSVIAALALGGA
jgi:hypothetical protein